MTTPLKNKTLKGAFWSTIERLSVQSVGFVVMIIMAQVISPFAYGLVGMLMIFIDISQSLVDSGFSQALIRKQDRSQVDNSTVFYFNIVIGFVLYIILLIFAPIIADFYEEPQLVVITRVVGVSVLINSFVVVQRALLTIKLDFKTQARASFTGAVIGGCIGIIMAYAGFGVWAIVWYQIINLTINALLLWWLSDWRPSACYSWKSFHTLFGFGSKLAVSGLIDTIYRNSYLIVIGKVFKAADLGYYTRAHQFGAFLSTNVTGVLQRVTYPALCTIQDDNVRLREAYRTIIKLSGFVVFPLMMCLAGIARPLILILLNEEWEFSAVLLPILCFSMMWFPIHAINLNLLQVKGRSDLFLKLEIIKKIIGISIIIATIPMGLLAMCWGQVLNSIIALFINTYYSGRLVNLGFVKQLKDLAPALIGSVTMAFVICNIEKLLPGLWIQLICGIFVGVIWYLGLAWIFKSSDLKILVHLIRQK